MFSWEERERESSGVVLIVGENVSNREEEDEGDGDSENSNHGYAWDDKKKKKNNFVSGEFHLPLLLAVFVAVS